MYIGGARNLKLGKGQRAGKGTGWQLPPAPSSAAHVRVVRVRVRLTSRSLSPKSMRSTAMARMMATSDWIVLL